MGATFDVTGKSAVPVESTNASAAMTPVLLGTALAVRFMIEPPIHDVALVA